MQYSPKNTLVLFRFFLNKNNKKMMPLEFRLSAAQGKLTEEQIREYVAVAEHKIDDADEKTGKTALHYAAEFGHPVIVDALISAGADKNKCAANGDTPLHRAADKCQYDVIETLLKFTATPSPKPFLDPTIRNGKNQTALMLLIKHEKKKKGDTQFLRIRCFLRDKTVENILLQNPSLNGQWAVADSAGEITFQVRDPWKEQREKKEREEREEIQRICKELDTDKVTTLTIPGRSPSPTPRDEKAEFEAEQKKALLNFLNKYEIPEESRDLRFLDRLKKILENDLSQKAPNGLFHSRAWQHRFQTALDQIGKDMKSKEDRIAYQKISGKFQEIKDVMKKEEQARQQQRKEKAKKPKERKEDEERKEKEEPKETEENTETPIPKK